MTDIARQFLLKLGKFKTEDIDLIIENTEVETFKKSDSLIRQGSLSKKCYLVVKGCLRQFQVIDGVEKTSVFFLEGQPVIAYASYLNAQPAEYTVQCLENTVVLSGTREKEIAMHAKNPFLEYLTHTIMAEDFKKAENYIALLNHFSPEERYLMVLKNNPAILNRVPLVHIASYLGVTPESLSRIRKRILLNKV